MKSNKGFYSNFFSVQRGNYSNFFPSRCVNNIYFFAGSIPNISNLYSGQFRQFTTSTIQKDQQTPVYKKIKLSQLPKKKTRYRNAGLAVGFIISMGLAAETITTWQWKNSSTFRTSLNTVANNKEVQELIGTPITEGWRVSSTRNSNKFRLFYNVNGPKGKAQVRTLTVMRHNSPALQGIVVDVVTPVKKEIVVQETA
jgi:hypothetical protein